jgi:hypothetical protein
MLAMKTRVHYALRARTMPDPSINEALRSQLTVLKGRLLTGDRQPGVRRSAGDFALVGLLGNSDTSLYRPPPER